MKLYREEHGWTERLIASAAPSVTLRSAVPPHLAGFKSVRELAKIRVRAVLHPRQTPRWLHLLNAHPAFSEYVRNCPRFLYKVYRPYISHALDANERLEAIRAHYDFMFRRGLRETLARASVGPVVLAEAAGKSGVPYQIQLRTVNMFDREGELVLQLTQDDKALYTVAFTVAPRDGRLAVSVGCIQGGKTEDAREAIRTATRELHGIRPKQLMATLVRQLGHEYGCERMVLVSNRNRVIYKAIRNGRVLADYDQLWTELGAQLRPDGDWELACAPVAAPDLDGIPSKKRSEARKRHELVSRLAADVCQALR
ncbi:VirK/YbjX family protein [Massilia pinisoli]|uniref:VirK/YbjX family protein n=1 Tax=Massilia pinisoli TaxID=1772194 RepID=A0ABT1ZQ94_9BURK|nr:VirK/YbjX family protein [Massilia pinisoli]MCS0582085.1 VirK/YbjX family protein [Massilia pinisoli]